MQTVSNSKSVPAAVRLANVRYAIRDMAVLAEQLEREGKTILPLNIGDPLNFDFCTPPHLIAAVEKAMRDGKNGYAPSLGIPEAIQAIRAEAERKGIHNVQSAFLTAGVSEALDVCLTALVNPGENVLTPSPEYPLYSAVLAKVGAQSNPYLLDEQNEWQPDVLDISRKINDKTRAIVVGNPNNPTGGVYSRGTLETIAELARRHNLRDLCRRNLRQADLGRRPATFARGTGAGCSDRDVQRALERLSGSGLAGGLGNCQRRCGGRETLPGRDPPVAARAAVLKPSATVCGAPRAGRAAGSSGGSS